MKLLLESPVAFLAPLPAVPEKLYAAELDTPFGPVSLAGDDRALMFSQVKMPLSVFAGWLSDEWGIDTILDDAPLTHVIEQYEEYFAGDRTSFNLTVREVHVTTFTLRVHRVLSRIPWGETCTYGDIAMKLGKPGAARAVGNACGRNSVLIAVPCHRVVASNSIGGFGANLDVKKFLLEHEGVDWRAPRKRCPVSDTENLYRS